VAKNIANGAPKITENIAALVSNIFQESSCAFCVSVAKNIVNGVPKITENVAALVSNIFQESSCVILCFSGKKNHHNIVKMPAYTN
jgi:hypothetical protein